MNKTKSNLQTKLEEKGWEFLTNKDVNCESISNESGFGEDIYLKEPKTDGEIKNEHLNKGFKDVLVSEAYDEDGNFMKNMRSVYVKR